MIIYAPTITPRLRYIADFIGKEIDANNFFQLTDDAATYLASNDYQLNYSGQPLTANELTVIPHGLLNETGIQPQMTDCFEYGQYKAFFRTGGHFPFDIFAASFYLLSRYEEYLPHTDDVYGRYAHENSLAFRENFLNIPLVNIWIGDFKELLRSTFPDILTGKKPALRPDYLPTYDIDEAYAYQYKPFWKNLAGFARSFLQGDWQHMQERWTALTGKLNDPYDSYQWLARLHQRLKLKPYFFFIVASRTGRYDKNISPDKKAMQELIRQVAQQHPVGMHPSWQSGDKQELLQQEKNTLERIAGNAINSSRQHYIRFRLPGTFRSLMNAGIGFDFSMGYGSINGFRASVATSFYWYDLENESPTKLLLYPFCFMDANSFYEQKMTALQAGEEMAQYYKVVKQVDGTMISVWHNNFLGSSPQFAGWKEVYEQLLQQIVDQTPSVSGISAGEFL